jgi:hypothetical protein
LVRYIETDDNEENIQTIHEPPPRAHLVLLVEGRISHSFPLRDEVHLGRDKGNGVVVADQKVSRYHASLTPIDDSFILSDRGSANGTYLNGVLISQPTRLKDKDRISVGNTDFLFTIAAPDPNVVNPPAALPSPSPQAMFQSASLVMPSLDNRPTWVLFGCLGLIIVGLLLVLAVLLGIVVGRGPAGGLAFLWLMGLF